MTKPARRVVTGHDAQGRSVVLSDGMPPNVRDKGTGVDFLEIWSTSCLLYTSPTLLRLMAEHADDQIPPLLQRFCESQRYDVCAVRRPSQVLSAGAAAALVPWLEVALSLIHI